MMDQFRLDRMTTDASAQPVVILGGFLITTEAYQPMADWIRQRDDCDVVVIPVNRVDWLLTSWAFGWMRLLDRVHAEVSCLAAGSPTGRVTLIGHSSGGGMLRLYLSDRSFAGRRYGGAGMCNRLITLGSPHQARRATPLRAMVDREFPGAAFPGVDYIAVAGTLDPRSSTAKCVQPSNSCQQLQKHCRDLRGGGRWPGPRHLRPPPGCTSSRASRHGPRWLLRLQLVRQQRSTRSVVLSGAVIRSAGNRTSPA